MNFKHFSLLMLSILLTSCTSFGQTKVFSNADNIAINGYDVMTYHNTYTAVRGSKEYTATVDGVTYYFSSAANQTAFKENSGKYLPAFGGYCAFGMAQGATVPTDPNTFKIRDGKLYLFYNDFYEGKPFNTIVPWNSNETEMLTKANENWKKKQ